MRLLFACSALLAATGPHASARPPGPAPMPPSLSPFWACRMVGYQLNIPEDVVGAENLRWAIRDALTSASFASGVWYRFDGDTAWVPQADNLATQPDDLEIAVTDDSDLFDAYDPEPRDIGYTRFLPGPDGRVAKAAIVFKVVPLAMLPDGLDLRPGVTAYTLAEHELGHSLGLDHTSAVGDIMDIDDLWRAGPEYSAGDLARLAAAGCGGAPAGAAP